MPRRGSLARDQHGPSPRQARIERHASRLEHHPPQWYFMPSTCSALVGWTVAAACLPPRVRHGPRGNRRIGLGLDLPLPGQRGHVRIRRIERADRFPRHSGDVLLAPPAASRMARSMHRSAPRELRRHRASTLPRRNSRVVSPLAFAWQRLKQQAATGETYAPDIHCPTYAADVNLLSPRGACQRADSPRNGLHAVRSKSEPGQAIRRRLSSISRGLRPSWSVIPVMLAGPY